jgi:hypothetical protein
LTRKLGKNTQNSTVFQIATTCDNPHNQSTIKTQTKTKTQQTTQTQEEAYV